MTDANLIAMWAWLRLRAEDRLTAVRDEAWSRLDPPDGYEKSDPHLTVHPGFSVPPSGAADVAGILAYTIGMRVMVDGLSFYPSREEPAVVKLDVGCNIGPFRTAIDNEVTDAGGTIDRSPVPAHITLFKSADAGEQPEALLRAGPKRLESIAGEYGGWETETAGYAVERRI